MYYNPYQSQFQPNFAPQAAQTSGLIRVTGLEGAKAYPMTPNNVVALFDNSEDLFYIKTSDGAGFPTIRTFRFSEIKSEEPSSKAEDFISKTEFEDYKKELKAYVEQFIRKSESK